MKTKGIQILDEANGVIIVKLQGILAEISDGSNYVWSILFYNGAGKFINGESVENFRRKVNTSEKGLLITWEELNFVVNEFQEIKDILIVGCKDQKDIFRFATDQNMYESCNFVIEMIDGYSWEVFSFNFNFIYKLSNKFKITEFLNSDFQEDYDKGEDGE